MNNSTIEQQGFMIPIIYEWTKSTKLKELLEEWTKQGFRATILEIALLTPLVRELK